MNMILGRVHKIYGIDFLKLSSTAIFTIDISMSFCIVFLTDMRYKIACKFNPLNDTFLHTIYLFYKFGLEIKSNRQYIQYLTK